MIVVIDRAAPLLAERKRPPAWLHEIESACDARIDAHGPDEVFHAVKERDDVRDVVCVGRASTTSAVLSGVWAGGGEWRTLTLRHVGGPGPDPYAAALGLPLDPSTRWSRLRGACGATDLPLLRVDDVGESAPRLGLVAGAGAGAEIVRAAMRAEVGLRGWLSSAKQAVTAVRATLSDDVVLHVDWQLGAQSEREDASMLLASTVAWNVAGYDLMAAAPGEISVLSLYGAGGIGGLGGTRQGRARSASFREAPRVTLDGWSISTSGVGVTRLASGPSARFFVPPRGGAAAT